MIDKITWGVVSQRKNLRMTAAHFSEADNLESDITAICFHLFLLFVRAATELKQLRVRDRFSGTNGRD